MFDMMGSGGKDGKPFLAQDTWQMFKQNSMCYCVNYNDDNRVIVAVTVSALMIMHPEFVCFSFV